MNTPYLIVVAILLIVSVFIESKILLLLAFVMVGSAIITHLL